MSWKLYWEIGTVRLCATTKELDKHTYQYIDDISDDIKITKKTSTIYFILPSTQKILHDKPLPNLEFKSPFFSSMNKLRDWIKDDNIKNVRCCGADLIKNGFYVNSASIGLV